MSPTMIIMSFDTPAHDLNRVKQPPAALTTVLRVLQLKEQGQRAVTLQNILLDHGKVERNALVQVCP